MSLRVALPSVLVSGLAVAAVAMGPACSSSSGGNVVAEDDGGGNSSSSSSGGNASSSSSGGGTSSSSSGGGMSSSGVAMIDATADGGCPEQASLVLGAKIVFPVTWAQSLASNAGSGNVSIWLLSQATTTGAGDLQFSGKAESCGTSLPDIDLNGLGTSAVCAPGDTCGTKVSVQILPSTFAKITRTFPTSGMQSGWNPGATLTTVPALGLLGLTQASPYSTDTTAWPDTSGCSTACTPFGVFMSSYNSDDDMDGNPGITANPKNDTGANPVYTYPPTATTFFARPPLADQVYIVSRNEIALSGTRMGTGSNACTQGSGASKITLFDNHVVGCHSLSTSTNGDVSFTGPAGTCDSSQVSFLDSNRTIYTAANGNAASPTNAITGTVNVSEFASTATCADVLSALP